MSLDVEMAKLVLLSHEMKVVNSFKFGNRNPREIKLVFDEEGFV
jgi:hypothetical protein